MKSNLPNPNFLYFCPISRKIGEVHLEQAPHFSRALANHRKYSADPVLERVRRAAERAGSIAERLDTVVQRSLPQVENPPYPIASHFMRFADGTPMLI